MRHLILFISLLLFSASSFAQNKVLVYSEATNPRGEHVKNLLMLIADREVELQHTLPNLDDYEAVFLFTKSDDHIPQSEQEVLAQFLGRGGKLYVRGLSRTTEPGDPADALWNLVRDSGIVFMAMAIASDSTCGIKGTFAEGFQMMNPTYNEMTQDIGGLGRSRGLIPVLRQGGKQGHTESAWFSRDTSLTFLLTYPQGFTVNPSYGLYMEDFFLRTVACTYFKICLADVKPAPMKHAEIRYDPIARELHFPKEGRIQIFDVLGREVLASEIIHITFTIPVTLKKGTYFVRWQHGDEVASMAIGL